jgi:uncharacterized membrane protein YhhN
MKNKLLLFTLLPIAIYAAVLVVMARLSGEPVLTWINGNRWAALEYAILSVSVALAGKRQASRFRMKKLEKAHKKSLCQEPKSAKVVNYVLILVSVGLFALTITADRIDVLFSLMCFFGALIPTFRFVWCEDKNYYYWDDFRFRTARVLKAACEHATKDSTAIIALELDRARLKAVTFTVPVVNAPFFKEMGKRLG